MSSTSESQVRESREDIMKHTNDIRITTGIATAIDTTFNSMPTQHQHERLQLSHTHQRSQQEKSSIYDKTTEMVKSKNTNSTAVWKTFSSNFLFLFFANMWNRNTPQEQIIVHVLTKYNSLSKRLNPHKKYTNIHWASLWKLKKVHMFKSY